MKCLLPLFAAALAWTAPVAAQEAPATGAAAQADFAPTRTVQLPVSASRSTELTIWEPENPRGVALFSTGFGGWPEAYPQLAETLVEDGFVVLAPEHVDSQHYAGDGDFTPQQAFMERLADVRGTAAYIGENYPDLPLVAVGHSFGSLISMIEGGALSDMIPMQNPDVKAVLAFSSPGKVPGLVTDGSYATLTSPLLVVTGTADTVDTGMGYEMLPADHLFPVETSGAAAYGLVIDGGDHSLVANSDDLEAALPAIDLFLKGYVLGDADAVAALRDWQAPEGDRFIVHEAAQ
ncbi:serine aminopeptidase domain-containing protein [Stakelama tenebrarum]|uniref:Alpha/beta hydrolase n=1 Tax=Stakelama tenebrarum TaxID=2711215 RepID=A0A6G6Y1Z5_9SPHN|nr:alpha/beta hydrolase [Sphingosinithalassobacter tenebrarum]QIG78919.1 alpha/beta hydrolase [Sphingosinithalassobacter tenebrarum]